MTASPEEEVTHIHRDFTDTTVLCGQRMFVVRNSQTARIVLATTTNPVEQDICRVCFEIATKENDGHTDYDLGTSGLR